MMNVQSDSNAQPSNPSNEDNVAQQILNQLYQMSLNIADMRTQFSQLSTRIDSTQKYI